MVVMTRLRVGFWELVYGVLEVLRDISSAITIIRTAYSFRRIILKAIFPILIASLLGTVLYAQTQVDQTTLWNFPPFSHSPFPHLSLYAAPMLNYLTYSWFGALPLSIIYSTSNLLGRFLLVGKLSRRLMFVLLLFYPGILGWFSVSAETSFFVPPWAQAPMWIIAAYPVGMVIFRSFEKVIGRRVFGKQGLLNPVIDRALTAALVGMRSIGVGVYGSVFTRFGFQEFEDVPKSTVRATIAALFLFLSLISIGITYELGYTSILQVFYGFGVAPYALTITSGVVGWRIIKREAEKDAVARLTKSLDLFQRGAYPQIISIHSVVHLANTRVGDEINRPFEPWGFEKTLATLLLLQKQGYQIKVDTVKERVTFTLYPL